MAIYKKYNKDIYTIYEIFGIKITTKNIHSQFHKLNCKIDSLINNLEKLDLRNKARMSLLAMSDEKIIKEFRKERIIISLTSYPQRIGDIDVVLFSLINQSIKADKIILWLSEEEFPNGLKDVPLHVLNLLKFGVEIEFSKRNLFSYNKLLHSLKKYPDDIIITVDDDFYYPYEWLEKLYNAYLEEPNYIHCHRAHFIRFDKKNNIKKIREWIMDIDIEGSRPSYLNYLLGVGGVLYKSNFLHKDIFNEELFMKLAPKEDDQWFWAMAVLQGTKINVLKGGFYYVTCIEYDSYNKLRYFNGANSDIEGYHNRDAQLKNIIDYYGNNIMDKLLEAKKEKEKLK